MAHLDLSRVDVEDFLNALEVENVVLATDEEYQFSCPFPGHNAGDNNPSAYMNSGSLEPEKTTLWYCHGCKRKGNALTFLSEHENVSKQKASLWIRQQYDSTFREPKEGTFQAEWDAHFKAQEEKEKLVVNPPLDEWELERFKVDWADVYCEWSQTKDPHIGYLFNRGFEPETLMDWNIGYDRYSQRFTIPIRDVDGSLVGFKARSHMEWQHPRYLILGDRPNKSTWEAGIKYGFAPYSPSQIVFGLDKLAKTGKVILVEGELNVLAMHQMGYNNTVGLGGSNLSARQIQTIRWHADEVVLFLDSLKEQKIIGPRYAPDKAGIAATVNCITAFEPHMPVKIMPDHVGDAATMCVEEVNELLFNAQSSLTLSMPF